METININAMRYHGKITNSDPCSKNNLILENISDNSTVLECGTATGYMSKILVTKLNCTVYGIEIDEQAAKLANQWCKKIIRKDIEQIDFTEEFSNIRFDYIILADILEHTYDPWKLLKKISANLTENGKIIISIPNISHASIIIGLINGNFEYSNTGILDCTHIRFFTRKSLFSLVNKSGLYITKSYSVKKNVKSICNIMNDEYFNIYNNIIKNNSDFDTYQFVVIAQQQPQNKSNNINKNQNELLIISLENDISTLKRKITIMERCINRLNNHIMIRLLLKFLRLIKNDQSIGNYIDRH